MCIEINKHLFASYCGLVASGYSLTDLRDPEVKRLYEHVHSVDFPAHIRAYFSEAKTNQIAVNPYYPRGSDLSAACFFLGKPISDFLQFLKSCGSPSNDDPTFAEWISKLSNVIDPIEKISQFKGLWETYYALAEKKSTGIDRQIRSTHELLMKGGFATEVQLIFAPNLLQSPYLADFAFTDSKLYIIATAFSETAVLHEYFHIFFAPKRDLFRRILSKNRIDRYVDTSKMLEIGYMRDHSMESQCHALEDCMIRGIVGILASERIVWPDYIQMNVNMGFTCVPNILALGEQHRPDKSNIDTFIVEAFDCIQ
jgi:hypothetical protein